MSDDAELDGALLDRLWDFDDPAGSERRLRAAAADQAPVAAAELGTQVARALGLQERYGEALAMLAALADHPSNLVRARHALETGRVLRSRGDAGESMPWFDAGLALATEADDDYLRIDAMHMLALVDPDGDRWTAMALELADAATDPRARRWAGALHNNRGWQHYDERRYPAALADFNRALDVYLRYGSEQQVQFAREAVASCRQSMGTTDSE